jgi:hypothetical protein
MTEKQTDNTLPDLQNRFRIYKISLLTALLLLFAAHFTQAQTWSEPAVVCNLSKNSLYPDFTFDNDGNLHCVWSTRLGSNYYRIYYSRSTDDGETWSNPTYPSQNSSLWMSQPHIVCDSNNNLHLTYDHDVGSIYNTYIIHRIHNGTNWGAADTIGAGYHNRLVIDHNDRLHCLWTTGYYSFYSHRDPVTGSWSEILLPYGDTLMSFFHKGLLGTDNNLHFVGMSQMFGNKYVVSYFKIENGTFHPIEEVSTLTKGKWFDMALDDQGLPHFVWHHIHVNGSWEDDSTLYRHYDGTSWSVPEFILQSARAVSIAVDQYNQKHIVVSKEVDAGYKLIHFRYLNGIWENQVIDEHDYSYWDPKLTFHGNKLYLLYCRVENLNSWPSPTTILMRKYDIITGLNTQIASGIDNLKIAPNPFINQTSISFELVVSGMIKIQILNMQGVAIQTLYSGSRQQGRIEVVWNGMDINGHRQLPGYYILNVLMEKLSYSKILVLTN